MVAPLTAFQKKVSSLNVGDVHVYHVGHLAADIASSPSLTNIQMQTRGLHLMGRVSLRQRRVKNVVETLHGRPIAEGTEYSLKVLQPIHSVDFDTARKVHLEDIAI